MWAFFGLSLLVGLAVYLWSAYYFADQGYTLVHDRYLTDEEYQALIERDVDLWNAYWDLEHRLGREPTVAEIWAEVPPTFDDE